jgi:Mrp family chromosome partitioning ATPase
MSNHPTVPNQQPPPITAAAIARNSLNRNSATAPASAPADPTTTNATCVSGTAAQGTADSCAGCPSKDTCAANAPTAAEEAAQKADLQSTLSPITHKLLVLSGKGGVGKSTVCSQLAFTLAARGYKVGVMDVDICGPSTARLFGLRGRTVHHSSSGWTPIYVNENLCVMTTAFLLPGENDAVVWRGPRKNGLIRQFLVETDWGELDYLIIDTPPGTSDEHISTVQYLRGGSGGGSTADGSNESIAAVVVTTPEEVAMMDVRKELNFCTKVQCPVLGIIENMARYECRVEEVSFKGLDGSDITAEIQALIGEKYGGVRANVDVFPTSGSGVPGMAAEFGCDYLGTLNLEPALQKCCEEGKDFTLEYKESKSSQAVAAINGFADVIVKKLPPRED